MCRILTLTSQVLEDGHTQLLFWSYADTYVKDDPSDVWYNWTESIISIFEPQGQHPHQSMELNINYTGVIYDHDTSYVTSEMTTLSLLIHVKNDTCAMPV